MYKIFFDYFIKGKSIILMSYIYSSITPDKIVEISQKDVLFIEYLQKEQQVLINGVLIFLKKINIIK